MTFTRPIPLFGLVLITLIGWTTTAHANPVRGDSAPWANLNDPLLTKLVNRAIENNPGIDAARARIDAAKAQLAATRTPLKPQVSFDSLYSLNNYDTGNFGFELPAGMGSQPVDQPNKIHTWTNVLKAQYMVDLAGASILYAKSAATEVAAQQADGDQAAVLLGMNVARTYYDIVLAKMKRQLIVAQIENYETLLKLVTTQFNAGAATALDVLQQQQQLDNKKAQLPLTQASIETGRAILATLLGEDDVASVPTLPEHLPRVAADRLPKQATRPTEQSPALRSLKLRLSALDTQARAQKRTFFPTLSLAGQAGYKMTYLRDAYWGETWQVSALLSIPIYNGGGTVAALHKSRAAARQAKFNLEDQLRNAQTRIANAARMERAQREYLQTLEAQMESAKMTVKEAKRRYGAGLASYLNVLTANDVLQRIQLQVLAAQRAIVDARLEWLDALGGRWTRGVLNRMRNKK